MPESTAGGSDQTGQRKNKSVKSLFPIVGIGASAGGLEAFKIFFDKMPSDSGMGFVLIPHLDPHHKSMMTDIIGRHNKMPVNEVDQRVKIKKNHIYIIPPNRNLILEGDELVAQPITRTQRINLPIDYFFTSLARNRKENAIGIILSGTMHDGTQGLKDIKEEGGLVIVQSQETAQHSGMPQSAIETGMVDLILPIEEMPEALINFTNQPYIQGGALSSEENDLEKVLAVIHTRTQNNFSCYKHNTLLRRTQRRMGLCNIREMSAYADILKKNPKELETLLKDLMIGVTGFFREQEVWVTLQQKILPNLLANRDKDSPLRIWVPGCSTGEEAYTIAILVQEAYKNAALPYNAQIFATDIDAEAIAASRPGIFQDTIAAQVPQRYLKQYFVHEGNEYHIRPKLRESVVFAEQNLIADAPFSNLDLISCRNLLIYLNQDTQNKVMEVFHFSLRSGGYLILGSSETVGLKHSLFDVISKEKRIYRRKDTSSDWKRSPVLKYVTSQRRSGFRPPMDLSQKSMTEIMQEQLLKRVMPAAVLINKHFEILNLHGHTEEYLNLPKGDPLMELFSMIKDGLRTKLRSALHKVLNGEEVVTVPDARVMRGHHYFRVCFTVSPVREVSMPETLYLLTFEDVPLSKKDAKKQAEIGPGEESLVEELENELDSTRSELQTTVEELETSNEEMKASNEEMMSMNEELQSSNEELETSKEELQSMNEELSTVNSELQEKIKELEEANNDIANLMNSTQVATVFLDLDLSIRRFTPSAIKLFNLRTTDVGRPIVELTKRFKDNDLWSDAIQTIESLETSSKEIQTNDGHWFMRRILPFRTQDRGVSGLVLTFNEITDLKNTEITIRRNEKDLQEQKELLGAVLEHTHMMTVYLDPDFNFIWVNAAYAKTCRQDASFFPGKNHFELYPHDENKAIFQQVVDTGEPFFVVAKPFEFPDQPERGTTYWDWSLIPIKNRENKVTGLIFTLVEVTERIRTQIALRENETKFRTLAENTPELIARLDEKYRYTYVNSAVGVLFGQPPEVFIGQTNAEVGIPEDVCDIMNRNAKQVFTSETPQMFEFDYTTAAGTRHFETIITPETAVDGAVHSVLCISRNMTERIQSEEDLKHAIEEKEVLLREVHHRVKNNMQVIVALLRMHSRRIDNDQLSAIFDDCRNRVEAMSLIHESLYQSSDFTHINFERYLKKLCHNLSFAYNSVAKNITLKVEPCDISLNMDQGIAVGMVVAELIANAFQHAFIGRKDGEISVQMKRRDADVIELSVNDDGKGLAPDFDLKNIPSLGLSLVTGIVNQELGGCIDVTERGKGARFVIRFQCQSAPSKGK